MTLQEFKKTLKPLYWVDFAVSDAWYANRAGVVYMVMRNNNDLYTLVVTDFTGTSTYKFENLEAAQKKANDMMRDRVTQYFNLKIK